jgi:uncharacterized membrane protein YcaP (DUF421 family)
MAAVLRPLAVYFFLLVLFRVTGKRSLGQITTFDFVLLLVISEAVSNALLASDVSLTGAFLAVTTFLFVDVLLSLAKRRWPRLGRVIEDEPSLLMRDGVPQRERLEKERVDEDDILEAARRAHGLEKLEKVRAAILERHGDISIIPRDDEK